jgi:hypothetical protein
VLTWEKEKYKYINNQPFLRGCSGRAGELKTKDLLVVHLFFHSSATAAHGLPVGIVPLSVLQIKVHVGKLE